MRSSTKIMWKSECARETFDKIFKGNAKLVYCAFTHGGHSRDVPFCCWCPSAPWLATVDVWKEKEKSYCSYHKRVKKYWKKTQSFAAILLSSTLFLHIFSLVLDLYLPMMLPTMLLIQYCSLLLMFWTFLTGSRLDLTDVAEIKEN